GVDMAEVPAVGRHGQIVGVEDRDLYSASLDRRAPVGSLYVAIGSRTRISAQIVDRLFETAIAALLVLDAVSDDEQHFLRLIAGFVGAVPRVRDVSRLPQL